MEDKTIKKLNILAADLPEVPRKEDGTIDLEAIATGKTEKDFYIVPDEIFNAYYKELPAGTINQSKTKRATATGGYIGIFGGDPEADKAIQKKGAETLNAANAQRRKLSETIDIFLKKKASIEEVEQLGLEDGATKQDALIASMLMKAIERGDVQAGAFIRDTAGEKPTEKIAAEVETITPEDRKQIERILNRDKIQDIVKE
jgi:hypothetical protein